MMRRLNNIRRYVRCLMVLNRPLITRLINGKHYSYFFNKPKNKIKLFKSEPIVKINRRYKNTESILRCCNILKLPFYLIYKISLFKEYKIIMEFLLEECGDNIITTIFMLPVFKVLSLIYLCYLGILMASLYILYIWIYGRTIKLKNNLRDKYKNYFKKNSK